MHVLGRIVELLGVAIGGHDGARPGRAAPGPSRRQRSVAHSGRRHLRARRAGGRAGGDGAALAREAPAPPPAGRQCGRREEGAAPGRGQARPRRVTSGRGAAAPPGGAAGGDARGAAHRVHAGQPRRRRRRRLWARCRVSAHVAVARSGRSPGEPARL